MPGNLKAAVTRCDRTWLPWFLLLKNVQSQARGGATDTVIGFTELTDVNTSWLRVLQPWLDCGCVCIYSGARWSSLMQTGGGRAELITFWGMLAVGTVRKWSILLNSDNQTCWQFLKYRLLPSAYRKGAVRRHLHKKVDNQVSQSLEEVPGGKAQLWELSVLPGTVPQQFLGL